MGAQPSPLVSIVVVNYNGQAYLAECLAALHASANLSQEIVVVDNASTDDSVRVLETCATDRADFGLLKSPVNRGYAGGVNLALPHLRGKYLAILNPDITVTPAWLTAPLEFLETHPAVGALSPLIVLQDDEERINAAGQDIHLTGLGFNRWLWRRRSQTSTAPMPVAGLHGSAIIIRRALLEQLGGWDESGFLYHEDVALSWLLHLTGHELYCLPASVVRHHYHLTMYPEKLFLLERNRLAMLVTYLQKRTGLWLLPWLLVTEGLMWGYCLLRGWRFLKAKLASYLWLRRQWPALLNRRQHIQARRTRSDWQVFQKLKWNYAWDQFLTLGRERGPSRRQPAGGLPVRLRDALKEK